MTARTLMVQGTSSSVGKSLLVAGLCRLYARRGLRVMPFKAQNMSNNAGVTPDGGEIGRAQVNQAEACRVQPHVDMNPILLKPEADTRSQVVVLGKPYATLPASHYYQHKAMLWDVVTGALARLRQAADLVIIEGAGSPAEVNLRRGDLVNMAVALHAQSPVLLAGDIDRGGVFAQLLGTLWLLEADERALVKGLIVNKFRGDLGLFQDGVRILEERGSVPVVGVVPWLPAHGIPEEDAVSVEDATARHGQGGSGAGSGTEPSLDVAVIGLPRIANFDDFDPLALEPGVRVRFVRDGGDLGRPDAVILPGTKHTLADLAWLRQTGLAAAIAGLARAGRAVVGICGGYQMLGEAITDPEGVEGGGEAAGLGLLPVTVVFGRDKATWQARAEVCGPLAWHTGEGEGAALQVYEIHAGHAATSQPLFAIRRSNGETLLDGAASADGRIWGTHLHGLFHNDPFRHAWLRSLGWLPPRPTAAAEDSFGGRPAEEPFVNESRPAGQHPEATVSAAVRRSAAYDALADVLEASLNMAQLDEIIAS